MFNARFAAFSCGRVNAGPPHELHCRLVACRHLGFEKPCIGQKRTTPGSRPRLVMGSDKTGLGYNSRVLWSLAFLLYGFLSKNWPGQHTRPSSGKMFAATKVAR